MNAVLDFPSIIEPVAVEKTSAITASIGAVNGEVAKFDAIAAGLAAIERAHPKDVIVADIATSAGMKLAEGGWRAYRNPHLPTRAELVFAILRDMPQATTLTAAQLTAGARSIVDAYAAAYPAAVSA